MLKIFDSILWAIATVLIVYSGIYYTFKLKFVQFNFLKMINSLFTKSKNAISPFESLMTVLGGRIGVGSIAGIALSIYLGGAGSIFWMWLIGIISAPNTFAETVLGLKYNEIDEKGIYKGGPSYYLSKGCNNKSLAYLYAIIIIISQIFGFLSIQSNTITKSLSFLNIKPIFIGIILMILSFLIIQGGITKISKISSRLVPIMTFFYVLSSLYIVIINYKMLPSVFTNIFYSAFNYKALGFGIVESMIIGVQRGIFSNESGLGTGAIASSTVSIDLFAKQGYVQMIGIYITTFLICTATAIVILTSDANISLSNLNGIEITLSAFNYHLGILGNFVVIVSIILFAFSTILSGYYDSESNLKYIFKKISSKNLLIFKLISVFVILIGSILPSNLIWEIVNILTSLLAIINFYGIMKLRRNVIYELKRYKKNDKMK